MPPYILLNPSSAACQPWPHTSCTKYLSIAFSGRIGRKALKPGSYRFRLVAIDAAGNKSADRLLKFRVVRR